MLQQQAGGWPRIDRGAREGAEAFAPKDVANILSESPFAGQWQISRARSGWSRRSFVAVDGPRRIFVKLDVAVGALRHLADLAVTPPVLHAGEYRGRTFVFQPYLGGRHPSHAWFDEHPRELGRDSPISLRR
jgi:hypothetical protein